MILGLYGDSRSGKDTVAGYLVEDYNFVWKSFAAKLRQILSDINPWLIDHVGNGILYNQAIDTFGLDGTKELFPESVEYMIRLGQSVRDNIHEDAWIWPVLTHPLPERLVISDVRQPNEYDAIVNAGGEVWRILRPGTTRRGMDGLLDNRYFSVTLHNVGNLDDLRILTGIEVEYALQNRWS